MYIEINDLSEIHQAARQFLAEIDNQNVFAFYGDMGAGKTTFIKAVCEELGVQEPVTSPTFAIINEYRDKKGKSIYHFDFYRIKKLEEVFDFGYEDYFYSGNLCFIEWPELVESLLPENVVRLSLRQTENGARILENIQ
ncbi:MAG TPA: tRNA (adenosine(37)-N6)-threonylcarbamoyltransferase complex ATPase subunit type 1 TsaE [Dysgonamonadaceae bacterium]|jgi:tRNA threonylcarbamoyladenosine biosynthesis protein TsaE|uniref:tRNA (adenosine(37)-N6)-threonylcarbamoyltransferase complex ATPase subunit type 1 TsaE n=1 Tax=Seramator thermalis TaxID=2496270 RepID=UPI0009D62B09|nr:tRNA (adenosine(37)-N6)-threonylcarbamoyltransferase complex ATPase subunit type 1 TsaE [Seramator thermalis]MBP7179535.1 tRNA (adenosine(37)-N6)-threonylcarbamoyltransferase complex ATPase subunit type 1 TsaE [Dysgonamonadaceae bacterium]MDK2838427.1 tRNA threonylcarbamoyladenosine biosynthesis protein TsaE [Bacteroidota bacterium]OPZ15630.1 MAG: tRNA threonylcarbamoyladenosine biosynthesis protein TsaE [Bacteroidetes bacterium ADurb.BinA261]MBP9031488.1 tRNA (adenosine(37)-N6)-threonylcarb